MDRPQVSIPPSLGTVVGVFSKLHRVSSATLALTQPRIWHNYRRKSTEGLPGTMLILWSISTNAYQNFNFALKFQPQAFGSLTLIAWGQTLYYHKAWTATVATLALAASFGIMELILILTLRGPYERGIEWPMMLMAISASVIQVIDFWFLIIDYAGAFFSLMAIVAQQWFDALGASLYIACMVLETGIFASQAIWLWRVRHIRRAAKKAGKTYDEYVAENTEKIPRSDSAETIVDVEAAREKDMADARSEKTVVATQESTMGSNAELHDDSTSMTVKQALDALQAPPAATLKTSGSG
ncbi:hypothetical protein CFE70_000708 [Pyrenophora teres f. teres 0-1]